MKFYMLKSVRGAYLTAGYKYLAQPYVAQLTPDLKPLVRYQVVNMFDDKIICCNMTEAEAINWLEEVKE